MLPQSRLLNSAAPHKVSALRRFAVQRTWFASQLMHLEQFPRVGWQQIRSVSMHCSDARVIRAACLA